MAKREKVIVGIEAKKLYSYSDATVIKAHDGSYDIELSDGTIKNYVENATNRSFRSGEPVSVIFLNREKTDCRIIGSGRKVSRRGYVLEVLV